MWPGRSVVRASPQGSVVLFLIVILFHPLSMVDQETREMELRAGPADLSCWCGGRRVPSFPQTCCPAVGPGAPLPVPASWACGPSCHLVFQLIFLFLGGEVHRTTGKDTQQVSGQSQVPFPSQVRRGYASLDQSRGQAVGRAARAQREPSGLTQCPALPGGVSLLAVMGLTS